MTDEARAALKRIIAHTDRHNDDIEGEYPSGAHFAIYAADVAREALDEIDRDLGVGHWYREDEWCPDCHMRLVNHGPNGEHP